MVSPSAINKICNPRPIPFHSPLFTLPPVNNFVEFCFQFRYRLFKTVRYFINRKVAEAVSRSFPYVDPLFYLSSFQTPSEKPPTVLPPGVFLRAAGPPANAWAAGRPANACTGWVVIVTP